jgi:hypothetical protein
MTVNWEPFQDVSLGGWWQAFQAVVPWVPPQSLELDLLKIDDDRPWLNEAVDIMAFGAEKTLTNPLEVAARRARASRSLCQAARKGAVQMLGSPKKPSDADIPIPPTYFDIPRQLGAEANSLDVFSDQISDEAFFSIATGDGYERWFNVRIKKQSFLNWLELVLQKNLGRPSEIIPPSDKSYHSMRRYGDGKLHTAAFDAMAEIWQDHRVPKSLGIRIIDEMITPGMQRRNFTGGAGLDNIRRILGLKD